MKKTISLVMIIALSACSLQLFASGSASDETKDTLILNDGKMIIGNIEQKSFDVYNNMQVNLNTGSTFIDEGSGKSTKVPNSNIHYFLIDGVKYANHEMHGGHKFMRVIAEGKISLYYWAGQAGVLHHHTDSPTYSKFETVTTTVSLHNMAMFVMEANGKTYNPTGKYLEKHFEEIFGGCKKLVQESKQPNYDFTLIIPIVKEYNDCN